MGAAFETGLLPWPSLCRQAVNLWRTWTVPRPCTAEIVYKTVRARRSP